MNDTPSSLDPAVQARVDAHLDAIDRVLTSQGTPRSQRQTVTGEVEAQVRQMLAARAKETPTLAELESVLAEIDPPEAYAGEQTIENITLNPAPRILAKPRLPAVAIAGASSCWPVPPVIIQLLLMWSGSQGGLQGSVNYGCFMVPGVVATLVLGLLSINEIRGSRDRFYGMAGIVAYTVLYPLLILDVLIVVGAIVAGAAVSQSAFMYWSSITLGLLVAVGADWWLVRLVWRTVNKSPKMAY